MSVTKYERSVVIMTLHWYSFQVFSFDNYVDDTPTEIDLKPTLIKTVVHDLPRE